MTAPLTIFGIPFSVHTRKVILAAHHKAIAFHLEPVVPVAPSTLPANWRAISPTGLIPAIDDAGHLLADSTAIVLYLERKAPAPALLPGALADYGHALFLDAWAGSALFRQIVHPLFHNQVVKPNLNNTPGDAAAIQRALDEALPDAFGYLESLAPRQYLVGDALSIADLAVISNLLTFSYLGHRIDAARYPGLAAYFRRHIDTPAVATALRFEAPFVDRMGLDRSFL